MATLIEDTLSIRDDFERQHDRRHQRPGYRAEIFGDRCFGRYCGRGQDNRPRKRHQR